MTKITSLRSIDLRFPTSLSLDGSDAMNPDPDYSAAYVVLGTDAAGLEGHGLTFTIGRGNEICCAAIDAMSAKERATWTRLGLSSPRGNAKAGLSDGCASASVNPVAGSKRML